MQNTGITYAGPSMTLLEKWGDLPHLVRAGKATLRLSVTGPATDTLYPLDAAGRRQKPIPCLVQQLRRSFDDEKGHGID